MKQLESLFQWLYATGEPSSISLVAEINIQVALLSFYTTIHPGLAKKNTLEIQTMIYVNLGPLGSTLLVPKFDAYARHIQSILPYNLDQASPLIANCLYRMAVWISDLREDIMIKSYSATLNLIKETLLRLGLRWKVAGKLESAKDGKY